MSEAIWLRSARCQACGTEIKRIFADGKFYDLPAILPIGLVREWTEDAYHLTGCGGGRPLVATEAVEASDE